MPDGSRMIRKVTCYYADEEGKRTKDIYSVTHFKNGLKHGFDRGYYRTEEGLYLTLFNKPCKKQPPSLFIRVLYDIIGFYPRTERYHNYWKNGELENSFYFGADQKSVDSLCLTSYSSPYDWSINFDLSINGDNQFRICKGDTVWRWNIRNNQLDGDLMIFGKNGRLEQQLFFLNGQLVCDQQFQRGILRKKLFYDGEPVPIEVYRYGKNGMLRFHTIFIREDLYSYRPQKYKRVRVPV